MVRTERESSSKTKSDPSTNGDAPGEDTWELDEWLDELLDQVAGFGVNAENLMAALSLRIRGDGEWPAPRPLPGSAPVPAWPGGLGDVADEFVRAVAASTATPPEIAAFCVLGTASNLVAGAQVTQGGPDWREPSILQLISIADSGEGKTPAMNAVLDPLDRIEVAWQALREPEIEERKSMRRMLEAELRLAEKPSPVKKKQDGEDSEPPPRREREDIIRELGRLKELSMPLLYSRDCTPEGYLGEAHAMDGNLGIITDEALSFFEGASRYNSQGRSNWDVFLRGYDGLGFKSVRASRDKIILRSVITPYTLLGQRVVLETLGRDRVARGLGLLARPLYSLPASMVGYRANERPPVPSGVRSDWNRLVIDLAKVGRGLAYRRGAVTMVDPPDHKADDYIGDQGGQLRLRTGRSFDDRGRGIVTLSSTAQSLFDGWREEHEKRLRPDRDLHGIRDWASKLPGQLLRLTGNIYALRHVQLSGQADASLLESVLRLADYSVDHALATFDRMGAVGGVDDAAKVLDWIRLRGVPAFSTRDVHQSKGWDTARVRAGLEMVENHGYIQRMPPVSGVPGRPTETWAVNPRWSAGAR